jgi:hypothetical protein
LKALFWWLLVFSTIPNFGSNLKQSNALLLRPREGKKNPALQAFPGCERFASNMLNHVILLQAFGGGEVIRTVLFIGV